MEGGITSLQGALFFAIDLTHVPLGAQQVTVTVGGAGYAFWYPTYNTFYNSGSFSLDFTIEAAPSPTQNSTSWNLQTVNADGPAGANSPIAVDSNGVPHIAYISYPSFIEYETWSNVGWSTQTVDIGTQVYSLALDSNNTPHLVYEWNGLMYATGEGSNWTTQTVDPNGASAAALAFDSSATRI